MSKKLNITLCTNKQGETYYKVSRKLENGEYETLGYASHIYKFQEKKPVVKAETVK